MKLHFQGKAYVCEETDFDKIQSFITREFKLPREEICMIHKGKIIKEKQDFLESDTVYIVRKKTQNNATPPQTKAQNTAPIESPPSSTVPTPNFPNMPSMFGQPNMQSLMQLYNNPQFMNVMLRTLYPQMPDAQLDQMSQMMGQMMQNPMMRQMMEQQMQSGGTPNPNQQIPSGGAANLSRSNPADLSGMINNPMIQQMAQQMQSNPQMLQQLLGGFGGSNNLSGFAPNMGQPLQSNHILFSRIKYELLHPTAAVAGYGIL
eukprot:NODE_521_length_6537_cov_0.627058.p4 type:complete len:261 gc:universal NODE_521_length_6537_cov_0.627058:5091-5873(+)